MTAEYKKNFELLARNVKLRALVPDDSETDEDVDSKMERRKVKLRRIENIEGSIKHIETINIAPRRDNCVHISKPGQVGISTGVLGLRHMQLRSLRSI